jgi:uncharacterized membrane protein
VPPAGVAGWVDVVDSVHGAPLFRDPSPHPCECCRLLVATPTAAAAAAAVGGGGGGGSGAAGGSTLLDLARSCVADDGYGGAFPGGGWGRGEHGGTVVVLATLAAFSAPLLVRRPLRVLSGGRFD